MTMRYASAVCWALQYLLPLRPRPCSVDTNLLIIGVEEFVVSFDKVVALGFGDWGDILLPIS